MQCDCCFDSFHDSLLLGHNRGPFASNQLIGRHGWNMKNGSHSPLCHAPECRCSPADRYELMSFRR